MTKRLHPFAVEKAIEEKFSKQVPKVDGETWDGNLWVTIKYENPDFTRKWVDTKNSNELDQIFDKYLKSYLAKTDLRTQELFIQKEIELALEYQTYYPNYVNSINDLVHFSKLQDWIDYLKMKTSNDTKLKISIELIGENKSDYSSPVFHHIRSVLEKNGLDNIQAKNILLDLKGAYSPKMNQNVIEPIIQYLERIGNLSDKPQVILKKTLNVSSLESSNFLSQFQESFFEYLIENYIKEEITPVKFSWIYHFMNPNSKAKDLNILLSRVDYIKYITERFGIPFSKVQPTNFTYDTIDKMKLTRLLKDFEQNSSSE